MHRHYELEKNEIIVASRENGIQETHVETINEENVKYQPCMWYPYENEYYPIMFSSTPLEEPITQPEKFRKDSGLMHPLYSEACSEFTNPNTRRQIYVKDYKDDNSKPINTVVWKVPDMFLGCFKNCYSDGVGPHQVGPHVKTPFETEEKKSQESYPTP